MENELDKILAEEERKKKALQTVADLVAGPTNPVASAFRNGVPLDLPSKKVDPSLQKAIDAQEPPPIDPLADAFKNGVPLDQVRNPAAMIKSVVAQATSAASGSVPASAVPASAVPSDGVKSSGVTPPSGIESAVDRGLADMRKAIERGRGGRLGFNASDAAERQKLLDAIEFGRGNKDPITGKPLLDDAAASALRNEASRTNRLQYKTTNTDIGAAIARALGQETRTPETSSRSGRSGGEAIRVTQAIRQSVPDWLGSIAKGQAIKTGAENVKQEQIGTQNLNTTAESNALDLKRQKETQTGDIQAQNIVDAQENIIGYRAGGKDRYLSATELEDMRYRTGNPSAGASVYQSPTAKAPAVPAAAPVKKAATDYKPGETVVRNGVTFVKRSDGRWESQ